MQSSLTSPVTSPGGPESAEHPFPEDPASEAGERRPQTHKEERVIIIAPLGQDGPAMANLLYAEGFESQVCLGMDECGREIRSGAGSLLLTEEALELPLASELLEMLKAQPAWSEL